MALRIKELRKEKGLTQKQLAAAIQSTDKNIWAYENNFALPTIETLSKLADYFEVSTDYLLGRSDETGIVRSNANLAPDEAELLDLYRQMSFQDKNQLKGFAKALVY